MKKWTTTFNDNHLRLLRVHIGFVILYIILALLWLYSAVTYGANDSVIENLLVAVIFFVPFILLHGFLAYGAKHKLELSRKISEIVFAFLLLGFPIGTLLSIMFFLPKTTWKQPEDTAQ